jgi:hypothetical protein
MQMCKDNNIESGKIDSAYPICLTKKDNLFTYSRSVIIRAPTDKENSSSSRF